MSTLYKSRLISLKELVELVVVSVQGATKNRTVRRVAVEEGVAYLNRKGIIQNHEANIAQDLGLKMVVSDLG